MGKIVKSLIMVSVIGCLILGAFYLFNRPTKGQEFYIATIENTGIFKQYQSDQQIELVRGTKVKQLKKVNKEQMILVSYNHNDRVIKLSVPIENLATSLEETLVPHQAYALATADLRTDETGQLAHALLNKGELVDVLSLASLDALDLATGAIKEVKIRLHDQEFYLPSHYLSITKPSDDQPTVHYSTYWDRFFGDGYSLKTYTELNYQPINKAKFDTFYDPREARAIYMTYQQLTNDLDAYLEIAKHSGINAFVIEMKGDTGQIPFHSAIVKDHFNEPEQVINLNHSSEDVKALLDQLKANQIGAIARVVAFKDQPYASAHPEQSIHVNGQLYEHDAQFWPSPHSRDCWMYLIDYSKELASLGFDEIQYDYVRFPDGLLDYEMRQELDLMNPFNETKVEAIQRFLMYASDQLNRQNVYVAADLFAWNAIAQDDQNIGQFYPSISNVVDVINPMVYPDHFSKGNLGLARPANQPYELVSAFSQSITDDQANLSQPALYRPWLQGYPCMPHVCKEMPNGYGPNEMKQQIQALFDQGYHSYMIWNGTGEVYQYQLRMEGFIEP